MELKLSSEPAAHWWIDTATGAAPLAVRALFASYAELNPDARESRDVMDTVGALMLDDTQTVPVATTPTTSTMVGSASAMSEIVPDPLFPMPLQSLGFQHDVSPWRSRLGGISARKIDALCEPGVDARLFKIEPGASIPAHDHDGSEFTLVLSGGFADQSDEYHRGDMNCARPGYVHRPRGLPGVPCVCFAVSIGGYRFKNPLMSFVAPWLK